MSPTPAQYLAPPKLRTHRRTYSDDSKDRPGHIRNRKKEPRSRSFDSTSRWPHYAPASDVHQPTHQSGHKQPTRADRYSPSPRVPDATALGSNKKYKPKPRPEPKEIPITLYLLLRDGQHITCGYGEGVSERSQEIGGQATPADILPPSDQVRSQSILSTIHIPLTLP